MKCAWQCPKCGFNGDRRRVVVDETEFPVHCICGYAETYEEAVNRNVHFAGEMSTIPHRCQHLQGVKESFNGRHLACGCSRIYLYPCRHFDELVTLHAVRPPNKIDTADDVRQGIGDFFPEYKGRACQGCDKHVSIDPSFTGPLPIPTGGLAQGITRGVITGANEQHWTCLGALAIAAYEQRLGFAVADHGLTASQRAELERVGVRWIEHEKPELVPASRESRIWAHPLAWWKPWICLMSPFERSTWIDADAVVTGDLTPLFDSDQPLVSDQSLFVGAGDGLYQNLLAVAHDTTPESNAYQQIKSLNSGVLAWNCGDAMVEEWVATSTAYLRDPVILEACNLRDQSSLMSVLMNRMERGQPIELLPPVWNYPADGLDSRRLKDRKKVSRDPKTFLAEARIRHPSAIIVHWLGKPKPWELYRD
jgi:hypothetical protein